MYFEEEREMKNYDIVIIGGGPAGLAAAIAARKNGTESILILERDDKLGGILNQCIHNGFGLHTFQEELTGPEYAGRFIAQTEKLQIEYKLHTMVMDISEGKLITAMNRNEGMFQIQAKAVILAMGCRERSRGALNIPGYRPAGIFSAGTAQRLVNIEGYLPGRKVVILGSGDIGLIMARRMTLEGADVQVVAELMPYSGGLKRNIVQCLDDFGIPLKLSHTVVDIKGKESASVDVVEKVIKNYVSILKQYEQVDGNTTFLNAEKGITFEIYYPNGNKYGEIKTDKNGYASLNLPYGVWKFHQVNTTTGYEKIYDFYITVNETSEKEQYYNILNNTLYAYLQVIKVDSETGKTIAIANTTFKILDTDTNQYVSQYVGGKVYSEFKTDENGKMITYLKLPAGNYKLIEVSAPNGYLKDKDGLKFTIGNDTHYSYTTYGAFITVTYKNTPIKGQLEIKKTGENLVIKDGKYTYKDKKLSGVTFEIYAEEDVKSADGNHLYYEKGTKVDTITTDKNGYAISKKLPLGKYYLIEVKTQDEYVLDSNKHYFELKEVNDETPIVFESYSNLNYLKKGTLEFTKKDLVNGDVIPNTIIEIYNENDELIFTGKTDKDGKVIITDLKVGKYYIIEKEAATGYTITDENLF